MYKGVGCVGYTGGPLPDGSMPKCLGCSGMGNPTLPPGVDPTVHPDASADAELMRKIVVPEVYKAVGVGVVAVLIGMYVIEEYWGRH